MVVMLGAALLPTLPTLVEMDILPKKVTFVQALNDKYVDQEEFADQFKVPKDRSISTEITFVGFNSVSSVQRQLRRLVSIDLSDRHIETAGDLAEIAGSLNRVTILNLSGNHLTWQELIKILNCLPNLQEIILSSNDLNANEDIQFPEKPFRTLISLVVGRINLDWSALITILSRIWTSIEQIDLWDNQLSADSFKLRVDNPFVTNIKSLRLSQNSFQDLVWTSHVGHLKSLSELDVSRCRLKSIDLDAKITRQLENLTMLNISYNDIADWTSISKLNHLTKLRHLICNDNPIFITEKFAKAFTVARVSTLNQLNREEITPSFRRDSEILYLRKTFKELREKEVQDQEQIHPRYRELIENYGVPEDLNANHTVEKYITLDLCLGDKSIKKKLPCDMRVSNLQMLCKRLFKLKPSVNIEIVCCEAEITDEPVSYPLDKEGQTLHFFSVRSNHRLVINELD